MAAYSCGHIAAGPERSSNEKRKITLLPVMVAAGEELSLWARSPLAQNCSAASLIRDAVGRSNLESLLAMVNSGKADSDEHHSIPCIKRNRCPPQLRRQRQDSWLPGLITIEIHGDRPFEGHAAHIRV